jgi:hypothetical protein
MTLSVDTRDDEGAWIAKSQDCLGFAAAAQSRPRLDTGKHENVVRGKVKMPGAIAAILRNRGIPRAGFVVES